MGKSHINISIDPYIDQMAKEHNLNISELAERAIVHKLNPENEIDKKGDHCEYCNVVMRQATANDMNGLYWFLPDEKWICPTCENEFTKKIINNSEIVSTSTEEHKKEIKQLAKDFVNEFKIEILNQIKNQEPFVK